MLQNIVNYLLSVMNKLYPLKFRPILKTALWGGTRIMKFKGLESSAGDIGESWEISGLEGQESIVVNGEFKGKSLKEVLSLYGEDILGKDIYRSFGVKFPLLIKFIDASRDLSIQVHPDDKLAQQRHDSMGKTELWYVIDSKPSSYIYSGFSKSITKEEFLHHIKDNSITDVIAKFNSRPRDIFYLPAGRIHSISAGNFIVEIQQNSDITYRVYDYSRVGADGKKRELHMEFAKDALDYNVHDDYLSHADKVYNSEVLLKKCPYFTATVINVSEPFRIDIAPSFRVIIVTQGKGLLIDSLGNKIEIKQGETLLIPACTDYSDIIPEGETEVLTAYI